MSSRSRRVKPEAWKAGDVVWVQYKAGPARGTLDKRLGETTWNVSFDDGEETQIIECLLLREQPTEEESGGDDDAPATVTPVRKKQKRSGGCGPTISADCGAPRDKRIAKLFYQFLWFRATQRRRMYPRERVVGSGKEAGILGRTSCGWPNGAISDATSTAETA